MRHRGIVLLIVVAACHSPRPRASVPAAADTTPRVLLAAPVRSGHEFAVAESPDGRVRVLSRRTFASPTSPPVLHLLETRRTANGAWSVPVPVPFSGGVWRDIDPIWSPDGTRLLFNSTRPAPGRASDATDFDVWVVFFRDGEWGEPMRLPAPLNTIASETYASMTREGTIYMTQSSGAPRGSRIVRSRPLAGGAWSGPETLSVVNATGDASNPFIVDDESLLLFVDRRPGGEGDSDLYVSERRGDSWTEPRALPVNTARAEFAPVLSADRARLLFGRLRRGGAGEPPVAEEDVYVVSGAWALGRRR